VPRKSSLTNLTQGPILKGIFLFALPVILGNFLQEMYNTVDMLIVGRTLGVVKLASIGATGSLVTLANGFIIGSSNGYSIPVAQSFGADDREAVKRSIAAHILIGAAEAVFLTVLFLLLTNPLLRLLRTTSDAFQDASVYLSVIYAGIPATIMYNMLASILRACGNSRTPLLFLMVSSVLNILLDIAFILLLRLDVAGAAIATVISQLLSGVLCLLYIRRRIPEILPARAHFSNLGPEVRTALKVGVPLGLQLSMISLSIMVLAGVTNSFGSNAIAARTVASRVQRIIEIFTTALGTVIATYVGQNYGARNFERIRKGVRQIWLICFAYMLVIPTLAIVFRIPILHFFLTDGAQEAYDFAEIQVLYTCPFMWILSFLHVYRGAVTGLGKGVASFAGGVAELVMRVAVSLLFVSSLGFAAVVITGPAAWIASAVMMVWVFFVVMRKKEVENRQL